MQMRRVHGNEMRGDHEMLRRHLQESEKEEDDAIIN